MQEPGQQGKDNQYLFNGFWTFPFTAPREKFQKAQVSKCIQAFIINLQFKNTSVVILKRNSTEENVLSLNYLEIINGYIK